MKCPKCKNKLREDLFCEKCSESISEEDIAGSKREAEQKLQVIAKKIAIITPVVVIAIIVLSIIFVEISSSLEANEQYDAICELYSQGNYDSALYEMYNLKEWGSPSKKQLSALDEMTDDIEEKLFELSQEEEFALSACDTYLEHYPHGKYLSQIAEKKAICNLGNAILSIDSGKYIEAASLLEEVIKRKSTPQQYTEKAQTLLDSIESQVEVEKGNKEILGTWMKATGVIYTFEENGSMSVSLSEYYDSSAGTALDGREVLSIVDEIGRWGRVIRGGTWKCIGYADGIPTYTLYYQSSSHVCVIVDNELRVILESGLGDVSFLTKEY